MTRCATDTGTSHKGMYNPVLSSSTALYTNNSMLDNVSSFDRITAVTCVCKLLYAVLTNTLSCHSSHTSIQNGCSLTLYAPPRVLIEVLFVKVTVFILLLFATLPECSQNQTAVSDTLRLLSDF